MRPIILPWIIWFAIVGSIIVFSLQLSGCATEPEVRVCYMHVMGQTDTGFTVVAQQCVSPEAFAESQK